MSRVQKAYWIIAWGNQYTQPTGPQELARVEVDWTHASPCPPELLALAAANPGYATMWQGVPNGRDPRRIWSPERKAQIRQRNLRKRIERDAPLFMDELFDRELQRAPVYFDGR